MVQRSFWPLLLGLIFSTSCKKILDTQPEAFATPIQYYATELQLNDALTGVYSTLSQRNFYGDDYLYTLNTGNDESWYRVSPLPNIPIYIYGSTDAPFAALWANLYTGINNANLLLENINKPTMDENKRASIKGQALFLRAYYYFMLVQHWGDVPLKLTNTKSSSAEAGNSPRVNSKIIYDQIIADMSLAETLVQDIQSLGYSGRVSKSAVRGILARVCLYAAGSPVKDASRYTDALKWAQKVIDPGFHALNPDFKQIFINETQDKYDVKETIWEVEFAGNSTVTPLFTYGTVGVRVGVAQNVIDSGYVYAYLYSTGLLYKAYESTDLRRDWTIASYNYSNVTVDKVTNYVRVPISPTSFYNRFPAKWRREYEVVIPRVKAYSSTNFPILRYADVLLMLAEAENELNGPTEIALAKLNEVRGRAQATIYTASDSEVADQASFRTTIQDERFRELAFECLRSMDLVRWGLLIANTKSAANDISVGASASLKFGATAGNNISARNVLWPIPIQEVSLNKAITQNPGY